MNEALKNEKFEKKSFWLHKKTFLQMILIKLAYETYEKYLIDSK